MPPRSEHDSTWSGSQETHSREVVPPAHAAHLLSHWPTCRPFAHQSFHPPQFSVRLANRRPVPTRLCRSKQASAKECPRTRCKFVFSVELSTQRFGLYYRKPLKLFVQT